MTNFAPWYIYELPRACTLLVNNVTEMSDDELTRLADCLEVTSAALAEEQGRRAS